jgi:hypothetical protein
VLGNNADKTKDSKMKTVRSEKEEQMAIQLMHAIAERKEIVKQEEKLKEFFKTKYAGENFIKIGDVIIQLSEKSRENLSKDKLIAAFGEDKISPFITVSSYIQLEIKGA